jgi:hypothetical protein
MPITPSSNNPRPRGRPMMAASELRSKKPRTAPPTTWSPPRTQSWLERLPVELIEQIFLHSLEISMAYASPFLCKTLSKESMYRTLILFAFFDDDEQNPVEEKHFKPAAYRLLSLTDKLRIQKGVLESRWCTMARVKQCLPTLMRLVIVQEWHRERDWECAQAEAAAQRDGDHSRQQPPSSLPPLDHGCRLHLVHQCARLPPAQTPRSQRQFRLPTFSAWNVQRPHIP